MRFLVRDRGALYHPIIGIGALGSSIIALRSRDQVIGWDREAFFARAKKTDLPNLLSWARSSICRALDGIYTDDLIEERLIFEEDLVNPSEDTVGFLRAAAEEASRTHRNHTPDRRLKETAAAYNDGLWETRAKTPLFRSKRCSQLANILRARRAFAEAEELEVVVDVATLLRSGEMRWALAVLVRFEKAQKVGIAMADLTVCGSVSPYNALIGGKLVSAMAVSPEIIRAYRNRYSESASEIASAMAGRRIVRTPDLVLFGTTSLYGVTSSQYNRLKIPCDEVGGETGEFIRYQKVGRTASFGTSNFSERTIAALVKLTRQSLGGLRVSASSEKE